MTITVTGKGYGTASASLEIPGYGTTTGPGSEGTQTYTLPVGAVIACSLYGYSRYSAIALNGSDVASWSGSSDGVTYAYTVTTNATISLSGGNTQCFISITEL